MPDEKDENIGLSNMQESPRSVIFRAFRHGTVLTGLNLLLHLIRSGHCFGVGKKVLSKLKFSVERFAFQTQKIIGDKRSVLGAIVNIIKLGIWHVLLSLLLVVVVYWLQLSITLPPVLRSIIESLTFNEVNWLTEPDGTTYITILTTIAGMTGVFLALYFTTLSMVAISYSEPHQREIRNLVIENAVSRGYVSLLAHLGAICLFGLAFFGLGFPPSLLLMIYILMVAGIVIFSFFLLGRHIFRFLDPMNLVGTPAKNFLKSLRNATILGRLWKQPSFQHHFQKQASHELYRLECINEFVLSRSARSEIVKDLCINSLNILSRYVTDASKIPSLSKWFPRKRVFQKWGFTSSIQIDITMRTGTTPQPEERPDYLFVCKAITRMVQRSLEYLLKAGDYSEASAILIGIFHTMGHLGENLAIDEAHHLLIKVRDILFSDNNGMSVVETNDQSEAMSMTNAYGACILNLVISASQNMERRSVDDILSSFDDLRTRSTKQLLKRKHPREVLRHLEEFHQNLVFERKTEGNICSVDWFLREHFARRYADFIWHLSEQLVQCVTDLCIQPVEKLINKNALWATAELLRSNIETTKKMAFRINALSELHHNLATNQVNKEDWINAEFVKLEQKLQIVELELMGNVANIAHKLTSDTDVGEAPDYAGIFRAYLGDVLVSRMEKQDLNEFENLFKGIFKTTFEIASRHIRAKDEHFSKPHMKIAFDTIIDLLDLSGLALLFSELQGSGFYEIVKKEWDAYFDVNPDGKMAIQFFYGSIDMVLQLLALSPSGTGRFHWERSFMRAMANAGFNIEGQMYHRESEEKARTEHTSRIIQSIRPHMGMIFCHPYNYFATFYLSERPEAAGIDLPNSVSDCKENVDREKKQREGENGS